MRIKKGVKTYKQAAVNAVILAVILCLFLYMGIQFSRNFSTQVSTQRTQIITDTEYVSLTGYIFRDETLCRQAEPGVADYLVSNGEKIGVGMPYVDFYPMGNVSDRELQKKQAELNDVSEQISRLQSGLSGGGTVSDLAHIGKTLSQSYYAYINAITDHDFAAADKSGELLLDAIVDHTVVTGHDGAAESSLAVLTAEKQELLKGLGSSANRLYSKESCYLFHSTDGYESTFASGKLEGLTPDGLAELVSSKPAEYGADVIGKTVYDPEWFLALPTDEATCLRFTEGMNYQITFSGGGKTVSMVLQRICIDESGDGDAYLLFSSYDLAISGELLRNQNVKILMDSCTGYRIPTESLTKLYGEDGVFIQVGNMVEFRRVTVIGAGNGYLIVNTYQQDLDEGTVSEIPYLNVNDLIITSGNDLYDGKLLD
ncbi:MAG: hypothetical protein IJY39_10145 [Clostridia bacterium]|nr:hypothetical protein [Clostridia bacterium]